jgi:NAD(P)-dependent dehydrogenase (short-subunit alcohol dehydrogenase family)
MDYIKSTVSENLGKIIPGNEMAPKEGQFSLEQVPDLTGKVAVVTGGTEGIGYAVTHTLLKNNISKIFVISLDKKVTDEASKAIREEMGEVVEKKIEWLHCDLSDWEAIGKLALEINSKTDRIDILVNNAGRGIMAFKLDDHGIDLNMSVNHFGHVILTSHLLPTLKETAQKGNTVRIVNMSSNAHQSAPQDTKFESLEELSKDLGPNTQYGRSKLATLLYSKYLHSHLHSKYPNILANATHPGVVDTRQSAQHILEAYPVMGHAVTHGLNPFKKTQFEGAVSMMYAATTTTESGQYICPPAIVEKGSELANDPELAERLMDLTWKIVKEKTKSASADKGCPFKEA